MFTTNLDKHDTQGWEQVECPKQHKSNKTSNLNTIATKLAETQIIAQAKETSFKLLLDKIDNDELMETENKYRDTDDNTDDDDDEAKDARIIDSAEDVDEDDEIVTTNTVGTADADADADEYVDVDIEMDDNEDADEIEEFPDDRPRATHSYKNYFPDKTANEYKVTKWISILISFKKPDPSNGNEANQVRPYMVKLASMINNTPKLNNK